MSSLVVRCTKTQCELVTQIAKATCYSTKTSFIKTENPKTRESSIFGKLDEFFCRRLPQEKELLKPWPNSVNPYTGEIGGPAGPEPTRYGDWERKGRVSDF